MISKSYLCYLSNVDHQVRLNEVSSKHYSQVCFSFFNVYSYRQLEMTSSIQSCIQLFSKKRRLSVCICFTVFVLLSNLQSSNIVNTTIISLAPLLASNFSLKRSADNSHKTELLTPETTKHHFLYRFYIATRYIHSTHAFIYTYLFTYIHIYYYRFGQSPSLRLWIISIFKLRPLSATAQLRTLYIKID